MSPAIRTVVILGGAALITDAAMYVAAVSSLLSAGPTTTGCSWLEAANVTMGVVAALCSTIGVLLALRGQKHASMWMAALTAITFGGAIGLRVVALALANAVEEDLNLNSLLLALIGTGADLMAVSLVLAAGTAAALLIRFRRARSLTALA